LSGRAGGGFCQRLRGNRIDGFLCFGGCGFLAAFTGLSRPNMEPAADEVGDFPCSPNALALAQTAVKDIVYPHVTFGSITLFRIGIVAASDEKSTDVINAIASHRTVDERQLKINTVPIPRAIIVETNPWAGGEKVFVSARTLDFDCQAVTF
jgi:hypothetical protein